MGSREQRCIQNLWYNVFNKLNKMKRLPIQHYVKLATEERKLPNGNCFYLPSVTLDLTNTLDMDDDAQETFANFSSMGI